MGTMERDKYGYPIRIRLSDEDKKELRKIMVEREHTSFAATIADLLHVVAEAHRKQEAKRER